MRDCALRTLFLLHLTVGCVSPKPPVRGDAAPVQIAPAEQLLLRELRNQVAGQPHIHVTESEVRVHTEPSHAVDGLTYVWGEFQPDVPSGPLAAVVGRRGDSMAILNSARSWAQVAVGWSPRNEADALNACKEFTRFGGRGANVLDTIWLLAPANLADAFSDKTQIEAVRSKLNVDSGQVIQLGGSWYADIWVRERRSDRYPFALKYRCEFPVSRSRGRLPRLAAMDSVVGLRSPTPYI
jgi:hypothetical protein